MPHRLPTPVTARKTVFAVPTKTSVSRIQARTGLTEVQEKTLALILKSPGITIRQMAIQLRVTHSTASYHLLALARLGLVEQLRDGRELRHFTLPRGMNLQSYVEALLRDPRSGPLLRFICTHPVERMTINKVARQAGIPFGLVRRTLVKLEDMHLVTMVRGTYRYTLRINPELRDLVSRTPENINYFPVAGTIGNEEATLH